MSHLKYLSYFILLHLISAIPQLNLYGTDWVSAGGDESKNGLQHDCLRFIDYSERVIIVREISSYCLSELPTSFRIENNDLVPRFSFADLSSKNITSQQLYLWSAPIDLIEHYQFYLNELNTSNDSSLATEMFYNCTIPRFGRWCQYEFYYYRSHQSSIIEIIKDFYFNLRYHLTTLPCYTHLQCNRGPLPVCLDWSEICDGEINCLDGGLDEQHCWQLEINQCQDNEYRCMSGQCIPKSFLRDGDPKHDCMDGSDRDPDQYEQQAVCYVMEIPTITCEDSTCKYTHLTSSCAEQRIDMLPKALYSNKDNSSISNVCWPVFKCLLDLLDFGYYSCDDFCEASICIKIVNNTCPDMIYFPNYPVLFGDIYFALGKNNSYTQLNFRNVSLYICYMNVDYNNYFVNISKISFNKKTCIQAEHFLPSLEFVYDLDTLYQKTGSKLYNELKRYHLSFNYNSNICNRSMMYQCIGSSKCISAYRLMDGINDCPDMDDENITVIENLNMTEQMKKTHFKCQGSNKFIPQSFIQDRKCDCDNSDIAHCEDENLFLTYIRTNILFQFICDGFQELYPLTVKERTDTDETDCERWECNNTYTRCDGIWDCPNGADEAGCEINPTFNCSVKHHLCVSPHTNQLMCLSINKANDGIVDCLGATDESTLCDIRIPSTGLDSFESDDRSTSDFSFCFGLGYLCNGNRKCQQGDDEKYCNTNRTYRINGLICWDLPNDTNSRAEWAFYYLFALNIQSGRKVFKLDGIIEFVEDEVNTMQNKMLSSSSNSDTLAQYQLRCHRGLDLRVWLDDANNLTIDTCLCPPSYYGNQCQYQNQRISLSIKFLTFSDSYRTPFAIIISLIDDSDQRIVHSYEHITYLSMRRCKTKFNMYLLYSGRPKDATKQYAIHIDFFEKISLVYRGSVLFPVNFSFLPVHRLAFIVDIPRSDNKTRDCSSDQCVYGKCIKYSNNPDNVTFCQCNEGWSGKYCTIQHTCMCAPRSFCLGISANNRSICVCPLYRFGPRCLLTDTTYQSNSNSICQNNSQYISDTDEYLSSKQNFVCLCSKEFSGDRCEIVNSKVILSFDNMIDLPQSIFLHFIQIFRPHISMMKSTVRSTTFQTIPLKQDSVTIYQTQPFHLVFTELTAKIYYLTVNQNNYKKSSTINKLIHPSDRCPNISELFNDTVVRWHVLRRIKYYHLPCQNQSLNLSCFHDEIHFCLCYNFGEKRLANCFNFDHNMTFDCMGQNECENGAQCLQDDSECPTRSMCICPPCFYGTRCQFSTSGFGLSLDAILGYHIIPNLSLTQQSFIVKMSLALAIIFIVIGFINGILCIITFKNKVVREVGCGLYLLGSSITTLLIMTMFGLKFLILILAQMAIISNRTFLQVQCYSLDFLLRICLCMDQWLNACVATERAMTVVKATGFDKKKSKKAGKIVIIILWIVTIGTYIHDPIYRRLIDEENNDDDGNVKRTWCIISYPSSVEVYNYLINIFHFFGPFIINLISAVILITKKSRQQANVHRIRSYRAILREQFQQHKHLLTGPIILIILALPRLIITFISKCMKSTDAAWLFLIGYFVSLIPPMLTFVIFILPSKFYKKEFRKSVQQIRTTIQRRLTQTS